MMKKEGKNIIIKGYRNLVIGVCCSFLIMFALFFLVPACTKAAVVKPSGKSGSNDGRNIMNELNKSGSVTLVKGKTYYLDRIIYLEDGNTVDATGATIYCTKGIAANNLSSADYGSLKDVTIKGGTWKCTSSGGSSSSAIKLTHANNVKLMNLDLQICKYDAHSIELVACSNITVSDCKITGLGLSRKTSNEEQIQIDIASPRTAPYMKTLAGYKSSLYNGAACRNIYVLNSTITGNRGVCANYSKNSQKKYQKHFHQNVVVKNCRITGKTAEGLVLFNTVSATVIGNTIKSKSSRVGEAYSVGCHFAQMYKGPAALKKGKITVKKNKIYGGRQAVNFATHKGTKYGKIIVKNNILYCKKGKSSALYINKSTTVRKYKASGNKLKKWNGK